MINFLKSLNSLCFYREILDDEIIKEFVKLITNLTRPDSSFNESQNTFFIFKSKLANTILNNKKIFAKTCWKNYVIKLILNNKEFNNYYLDSNPFPFNETLKTDLTILGHLYNFDFNRILELFKSYDEDIFNKEIYSTLSPLALSFESKSDNLFSSFKLTLLENKSGIFDQNKVFKIDEKTLVTPISSNNNKRINDLVGYESHKQKILNNTQAFIDGKGGLNLLLYGDMGTGKSSMILSLVNEFKDTPLRFIEIKKNELSKLPEVIELINGYNYPFILFIDDLSFDHGDDSYKELKNSLEGSLEKLPDNVLLYATSNKRTLVSQSKSEREDAVNSKEILEEKLSLVSRFGITIPFTVPNQDKYLDIVKSLAEKNNIEYTDKVKDEAIKWELRHMNRSGRTAEQFIQYLKSQS